MKPISYSELSERDFNLRYLNSLKQYWRETREFRCVGEPKRQDLLFFLSGCSVRYTDHLHKKTVIAHSGDVVYVPTGSEYEVEMFDFEGAESHTVGINFLLFDENGERVTFTEEILVFASVDEGVSKCFYKPFTSLGQVSYAERRLALFDLIHRLFSSTSVPKTDEMIAEGFRLLCENPEKMIPVSALARACNVSEVYFRRRFKALTGKSPVEYRNALRLEKARQYLVYGDISVQEISDTLGYSTVSHFIKQFRERYGAAPLEYRRKKRRNHASDGQTSDE